ncbi:MAG: hypothetical protein H6739_39815 [Alphaproteobacteria bacterium]|nr:hypothetical protein [Alphaproteobacteria bacterium]
MDPDPTLVVVGLALTPALSCLIQTIPPIFGDTPPSGPAMQSWPGESPATVRLPLDRTSQALGRLTVVKQHLERGGCVLVEVLPWHRDHRGGVPEGHSADVVLAASALAALLPRHDGERMARPGGRTGPDVIWTGSASLVLRVNEAGQEHHLFGPILGWEEKARRLGEAIDAVLAERSASRPPLVVRVVLADEQPDAEVRAGLRAAGLAPLADEVTWTVRRSFTRPGGVEGHALVEVELYRVRDVAELQAAVVGQPAPDGPLTEWRDFVEQRAWIWQRVSLRGRKAEMKRLHQLLIDAIATFVERIRQQRWDQAAGEETDYTSPRVLDAWEKLTAQLVCGRLEPQPGTLVGPGGTYELLELLARRPRRWSTWRARSAETGHTVALTILADDAGPQVWYALSRSADQMSVVEHRAVPRIQVTDGDDSFHRYIVHDWVDGRPLDPQAWGPGDLNEVVTLVRKLADLCVTLRGHQLCLFGLPPETLVLGPEGLSLVSFAFVHRYDEPHALLAFDETQAPYLYRNTLSRPTNGVGAVEGLRATTHALATLTLALLSDDPLPQRRLTVDDLAERILSLRCPGAIQKALAGVLVADDPAEVVLEPQGFAVRLSDALQTKVQLPFVPSVRVSGQQLRRIVLLLMVLILSEMVAIIYVAHLAHKVSRAEEMVRELQERTHSLQEDQGAAQRLDATHQQED